VIRRRPPVSNSSDASVKVAATISTQSELDKQEKKANRIVLDSITELADGLLSKGLTSIYSMTYEALKHSTLLWEYKGLDGVVYGPFTASQLSNWKAQGYFAGATAVLVRPSGENTLKDDSENAINGSSNNSRKAVVSSSSIYDDDMLDASVSAASHTVDSSYAVSHGYEWTSSDAVDFGEYINLDNDLVMDRGKERQNTSRSKPGTTRAVAEQESSKSRSRLDQQNNTEDKEDEDDNDNEVDGMSFRHKRKRVQHEEDDDDD